MKKLAYSLFVISVLALGLSVIQAMATGNGAPSGPHYNLNIIGVGKGKTADMTGSQRHTIFVALGGGTAGTVNSKIWLTRGEFEVCDGNGTTSDTGAFDCGGNKIATSGAVFQLPCNTNITLDGAETLVPCTTGESAAYEVWARALGKPGGSATIQTCAFDDGTEVCSTENVVLVREKGKSWFTNVTQELTSLCLNTDADPACETRIALFAGDLEGWHWEYDNNGLKLAQVRFYFI